MLRLQLEKQNLKSVTLKQIEFLKFTSIVKRNRCRVFRSLETLKISSHNLKDNKLRLRGADSLLFDSVDSIRIDSVLSLSSCPVELKIRASCRLTAKPIQKKAQNCHSDGLAGSSQPVGINKEKL